MNETDYARKFMKVWENGEPAIREKIRKKIKASDE